MRFSVLLLLAVGLSQAQTALPPGAVQVLVTVTEHKPGAPPIQPSDFSVHQGHATIPILGWERVPQAVQLWIATDDGCTSELNRHVNDLRDFILRLPPHTQAGLAYMSLSGVQVAAPLSADHRAVAAALRPPKGVAVSPDPYASLQSLLDRWPNVSGVRRELLVLSPGGVYSGGANDTSNPAVQKLIARVQRESIVVFGLSIPGTGTLGIGQGGENQPALRVQGGGNTMNSPAANGPMELLAGQDNLRTLAEQSGGWWNFLDYVMTPLSKWLAQIHDCIQHQLWIVYVPPSGTPSGLAKIKVQCKTKGTAISAPEAVVVP